MESMEPMEAIVGLLVAGGILLFGLKMLTGSAFRWVVPMIFVIAIVAHLPESAATQTFWNLIVGVAGPLLLAYFLFSTLRHMVFGPPKCDCGSACRGHTERRH